VASRSGGPDGSEKRKPIRLVPTHHDGSELNEIDIHLKVSYKTLAWVYMLFNVGSHVIDKVDLSKLFENVF